MAKNPDERFSTANGLAEALATVATGAPAIRLTAARAQPAFRLRRWGWVIVGVIGLAVLTLGAALLLGRGPEGQAAGRPGAASPTLASTLAPSATPVAALLAPLTQTPTPTASPTVAPTPTSPPTASPTITPSPTNRPTRTPTPQPAWVTDFAEPILAAIGGRTPDFQDDFSMRAGGWIQEYCLAPAGRWKYVDGEMVVSDCGISLKVWYTDFVAEMDARFLPGSSTDPNNQWTYHYRFVDSSDVGSPYWFAFKYSGHVEVGIQEIDRTWEYTGLLDAARSGLSVNHVLVIVKDETVALFVNDQPTYYNNTLPPRWKNGGMNWSVGDTVAFDNLKIWDISGISFTATPTP
jgi:hypothetical protein